jgi:hypothetical protein
MTGARDPQSDLWRVNLRHAKMAIQSTCYHAHDTNNQKELINYLHVACFSPVKSTSIAAIKNGIMTRTNGTRSGKNLSKSSATVKVHLNQQRMNTRSTKIKEEENKVTTEGI